MANAVIEAIRDGAVTSIAIAARLNIPLSENVACRLVRLHNAGKIIQTDHVFRRGGGRPLICWRVNEDWTPPPVSAETRAKHRANLLAQRADPDWERRRVAAIRVKAASVPEWVLPHHIETYREIKRVLDDQTAARWARTAKRLDAKSGDIEQIKIAQTPQKC